MSTYILTSFFPNGFNKKVTQVVKREIVNKDSFTYVASDFADYELTDFYLDSVVKLFSDIGIDFKKVNCVDDRTDIDTVQKMIREADVVWLAGGDTAKQYKSLIKYGLDKVIKEHTGVVFGMSAGAINLGKTAICYSDYERTEIVVYNAMGCVDITLCPHFNPSEIPNDIVKMSKKYTIYGLQDDDIIVCKEDSVEFIGDIYKITNGDVQQISYR